MNRNRYEPRARKAAQIKTKYGKCFLESLLA